MPQPRVALGDRSLYPNLKARAYLAFAATAPVSSAVKAVIARVLDDYAERGNVAFFEWMEQRERLRGKLGQLVGAQGSDIALIAGTTRGISDLALCLPWRAGERVVLFEGEFPANVSPWLRAAELFGLRVDFVPMARAVEDEASFLEPLKRLLQGGTRLVAVSAVQFQTGLCMPLAEIARLCRQHGAELCVDAIQACGAVPLDAPALGVDYLVSGAHKWLLGLEGVGFLYAPPERARALVPRTAGWLSHEDGTRFLFAGAGQLRYDRPIKQSVQMLEGGSSSTVGFAALEAAIDPLLELGPATILEHLGRYHDALEPGLIERGFTSRRAARRRGHSGILSVQPPGALSATELVSKLRERGVFASMPDGLLRFAPHFPNALSEIETVLSALDEALAALR
ncbi:MAG TPA: aminotransferase class V-fold PLP-dependent enzyme [Polyangiaceae bacterium]|nr:aminotransferase class V-fold PLP-dependent enzyme [Polyangiaceae bacterium]